MQSRKFIYARIDTYYSIQIYLSATCFRTRSVNYSRMTVLFCETEKAKFYTLYLHRYVLINYKIGEEKKKMNMQKLLLFNIEKQNIMPISNKFQCFVFKARTNCNRS